MKIQDERFPRLCEEFEDATIGDVVEYNLGAVRSQGIKVSADQVFDLRECALMDVAPGIATCRLRATLVLEAI